MAQPTWFSWNDNTPSDPSNFNYDVQAQKVKRARDAANALQALSLQDNKGQIIQNGVGTFYAGGNNWGTTAAKVLAAYLGTQGQQGADQQQQDLSNQSLAALNHQLSNLYAPVRDPNQDGVEAAAQDQRELNRFQSAANANQPSSDSAPPVTAGLAQGAVVPQDGQTTPVPLPPIQSTTAQKPVASVSTSAKKQAASALGNRPIDFGSGDGWDQSAPQAAPSEDQGPMAGILSEAGSKLKKSLGAALKSGAQWFTGTEDAAPPVAPPAAAPAAAPAALPPLPQQAPQGAQAAQAPRALPPLPQAQPPQAAPQLSQTPPAPQAPQVPQAAPQEDSNPNPYSMPPSQDQLVARLIALGRTGPEGQSIAQAQLNQMFASKNGRFTTDVKPDSVNGGFVAVTTDTATGRLVNVAPIGATGSGKLITGQTTDAQGNRLNVHKDGSTSPMMADGKAVQDPSAIKAGSEAIASLAGKRTESQSKLADLEKMDGDLSLAAGLVKQASVGPLASKVGGVYNHYIGDSKSNDTLDRILNDTRLQSIVQDEAGQGRVGAGLFNAYQNHSMSRSLSPEALSQGIAQLQSAVRAQKAARQAETDAYTHALGQLGYQDQSGPVSPAQSGARAAGNYSF